jgi:peptidoglycan/LPS O-acetylase OafA/YrhL
MNGSTTRPRTVAAGCAVSVAISVWDIASAISDEDLTETPDFLALLLVLSIVPVIFTVAAFLRRNWGRVGLAAVTVLGLLALPLLMFVEEEMRGPIDAEAVLYAIAGVVIIVLLFMPASNTWYRSA